MEHEVHQQILLDERVAPREATRAEQGVLHDAHHRLVALRRNNAARNVHDLARFGPRLHRLHDVQIHLVAIEVGIVRRGDGQVHAKRRVGHDAHAVRHDGHFVQRRLPIEHDNVAVLDVPLHTVAVLQRLLRVRLPQVQPQPVLANDVSSARKVDRAVLNELLQLVDVEGRDDLWVGQVARDGARHAHLVDGEVGVWSDDGTRREVDSLAHQVASDAALLALEPL
mmetsp:Transcript_15235/g.35012  ORF Transcript_15235/g.35012 Transcript_15235/m.35012 type:complete len:225 (+) Transcript_15235:3832-4506(+)